MERLGHFDDHVGLDLPALGKRQRRRRILGVALRRPIVRPGDQRVDVGGAQRAVIREMAVFGSANQGGIFSVTTATFMALAQGRASL